MATAPQQQLPLFYNDLVPLSSQTHANFKMRTVESAPWLAVQHAVPVTVEEFPMLQRFMPVVFSAGDEGVPIALMGLNEGINTFIDENGKLIDNDLYLPAYIRRYPFLLARLQPDAEEMSLCFDPTADGIGEFDEGQALFENGEPTEAVKNILGFNESFEQAAARTTAFMAELRELNLLMEGEVTIQTEAQEQPFIYRGFQMINEEKLTQLRGDQLRKMNQSGMLPLIYAHLFSLSLMSTIFNRQVLQGKMPVQQAPLVTN
jgi:hypothetical protein